MIGGVVAEAEGVVCLRGRRRVLDGPGLRVRDGTVTLLLGPNGAGKTTLLRALSGVLPLAAGTVSVGGRDPRRDARARAMLALVPQEIALYPRLTVRENLEVFAAFAGQPRRGPHIGGALERTALQAEAERLAGTLSGGLQRRANIASALVASPRLLLLDEPTAGLDPASRRTLLTALRDLATGHGLAILMITHDLDEAEAVADGVAVLREGRLLAAGTPAELLADAFSSPRQRVDVLLAGPPDPGTASRLSGRHLRPLTDRSHWRGYAAPGEAESLVAGLAERLVREVRLRRPGLEDAFSVLLERAAAA